MLDRAGLKQVKIFVSSSLDEYAIEGPPCVGCSDRWLRRGSPYGNFFRTRRSSIRAYKLAEYAGRPTLKLSESKLTLPGRKQVFREKSSGKAVRDVIGLYEEKPAGTTFAHQGNVAGQETSAGRITRHLPHSLRRGTAGTSGRAAGPFESRFALSGGFESGVGPAEEYNRAAAKGASTMTSLMFIVMMQFVVFHKKPDS